MYQVVKVLNNNGILAKCLDSSSEHIFLGKGIGFGKKAGESFTSIPDARAYIFKESLKTDDKLSVINNIDPVYLDIANEIILAAEKKFGSFDNNILLPLADHIAFCIERQKNGLEIINPLNADIKILFSEEYQVASQAVEIIQRYTGYTILEDEIGYITMHIHSALTKEHLRNSMSIVYMVEEFIKKIETKYHIVIDKESLSYNRLLTHIKYMIVRALKKEELQVDITPYVKAEFAESYAISKELCQDLGEDLKCTFKETEISYLAIHIERVKESEKHE